MSDFVSHHLHVPAIYSLQAAPGPGMRMHSTYSNYIEFSRTDFKVRGAIGALGSFEMNRQAGVLANTWRDRTGSTVRSADTDEGRYLVRNRRTVRV